MIDKNYLTQLEQQYGLPPGLLAVQAQTESGGNAGAVSPKGALGLFQFMPETAKQYGIDPLDPTQAAEGAARMNADMLKKYNGDIPSALAAYNWGSGNVDRKGLDNAPEETRNYISNIMAALGSPDLSGGKKWESEQESKTPTPIPWSIPGQAGPQQDAFSTIMNAVGSAIIPSAQAAENDIPPGFVPEEQKPSALSLVGASSNLPQNQQVQQAPLQTQSDNDIPPGFVPEENAHQMAVAQNMNEMSQGLSGAAQQVGAYGLNALGGMTGNFADEAISGLGALMATGGNKDFGDVYSTMQQKQQAIREAGAQLQPGSAALAQISGALIATPAIAALMPSTAAESVLGAITKGAVSGATYGGLSGAGEGDAFQSGQQSAATRLENAKSGGEIGALVGGGLGAVSGVAQKIAAPGLRAAKDVKLDSQDAYELAAQKGGVLDNPNPIFDHMQGKDPVTATEIAAARTDPVRKFLSDFADVRKSPLTLSDAQILDEELSNRISKEYGLKGLSKDGYKLLEAQDKFRAMLDATPPESVGGGAEGYQAWKQAQALWSQQAKMNDIERIIANGKLMDNPATSIRSGFRTLAKNPTRFNRYNAQEKALIIKASKAGLTQEALRAIGSRLLGIAATGGGFVGGGIPGAIAGNLAATAVGATARKASGAIQAARGQRVIDAIAGNKTSYSTSKPLIAGATQGIVNRKREKK